MDTDGKQIMGARLRHYRESAGLSILDVETRTKIRRSHLYRIEAGKANFSIDVFEKLLKACGVTLEEFLAGLRTSEIPSDVDDLYQMLDIIVGGKIPRQIEGIRVNLEAISEKVLRLIKARASPHHPDERLEGGRQHGGHREKKKHVS